MPVAPAKEVKFSRMLAQTAQSNALLHCYAARLTTAHMPLTWPLAESDYTLEEIKMSQPMKAQSTSS